MDSLRLSQIICNESENAVYISDPETYELIYMNAAARNLYDVLPNEPLRGVKCYEFLQAKDSPCEFCTNKFLTTESYYKWEHHNPNLGKRFLLKDKLIVFDGKRLRMEVAVDVTETLQNERRELSEKLSIEETLVRCIGTLKIGTNVDDAINRLLWHIGSFYDADRAYIFEIDYEHQETNNTYEWCFEGIQPEIDILQHVPLDAIERWMEAFAINGHIKISMLNADLDRNSLEYQILEPQGIQSLIAVPLINDSGDTVGFIGVDNPKNNFESAYLLTSLSYFVADDLNKRKIMSQLEQLSYEDALTGLNNRNRYFARLNELRHMSISSLGVIFMDVNGLKQVNDVYGHSVGDEIIKRAANHLKTLFTSDIYRIGGDEFVVLCLDYEREKFYELSTALRDQIELDDICSISIGAKWDDGDIHINELIASADELMYVNKQSYYQTQEDKLTSHRAIFANELIRAIEDDYYEVFMQPKVNLKTQDIYGAEALIRRREKDGSITSPAEFIPAIEAEGAIRYIDFFVLETVCKTLQAWVRNGMPPLQMAVNFSRLTLMEENVVSNMLDICNKYKIEPHYITVEVTESVGRITSQELKKLIGDLSGAGFSVSLDDFGAQYSNMSILADIDFDELKLDRSLIKNIVVEKKASVIIRHAIDMSQDLNNIQTVAEGIETDEQLKMLEKLGCNYGQGYLFYRPMPIPEFEKILNELPHGHQ